MKKIKNKFIILIFILIILIVLVGIYNSFFNKIDRNSYALLVEGEGTINDELMIQDERELLEIGDIVKSVGNESLVVIEWGDGSVTRLGPNSSVKVNELYVDEDLLQINLSFELLSGKTWSNVLNFMGSESYFKESFRDLEAGVRGTVFNVDLDNDYISVIKHKVSLVGENLDITIEENQPFSLKNFAFIKLEEFINSINDSNFEKLNVKFDEELLQGLKDEIYKNLDKYVGVYFENVDVLSAEKRQELYDSLLTKYQDLNFISSSDGELFSKKIELKETLISLASQDEKEDLVENTLYDFEDSVTSENYSQIDNIISILNDNTTILSDLDIDLDSYLENLEISDELKEIFSRNIDYLKNIFGTDFESSLGDFNLDSLKEKTQELYNDSSVKETLDEQVGFIKKFLEFLFNKN